MLYSACFIVPYLALGGFALAGIGGVWLGAAALGVAANLVTRGALAARFGHTVLSVLLHPFAVMFFLGVAINSFLWSRRGQIRWRGRVYAARGER